MIPALILSTIKFINDKLSKNLLENKIEKTPENKKLLLKSAFSNLKAKDYVKAVNTFKRVYDLEPNNKISLFYLGLLSLRLNRFEDTKVYFTEYLADPISKPTGDIEKEIFNLLPESYYYLGNAYFKLNDLQKADELKNKAILLNKRISKLNLF